LDPKLVYGQDYEPLAKEVVVVENVVGKKRSTSDAAKDTDNEVKKRRPSSIVHTSYVSPR
jgi:hypothetical protein